MSDLLDTHRYMRRSQVTSTSSPDRKKKPSPRLRIREQILRTASELFRQHGIRAVGVDMIVNAAGTNKMSFYRSFRSKDELVAEHLRDQDRQSSRRWHDVLATHPADAEAQLRALFEDHLDGVCSRNSHEYEFGKAAIETTEGTEPRVVVEAHMRELRGRFKRLAYDSGASEAEALGDALMLLWEGIVLTAISSPDCQGAAQDVVSMALVLLQAHRL
jgi:AcrR family transcriptional regulator